MNEPYILRECDDWAAVVKPHGMPSAPLPGREEGTLLSWFVSRRPEADAVVGKKAIERGLVHRLDTATWGIVLVAKNQKTYEAFLSFQERDFVRKRYIALCRKTESTSPRAPVLRDNGAFPLAVRSRFRPWGPKGREVRPLFPGDRGYAAASRDYETIVESIVPISRDRAGDGLYRVSCALTRGFRHQVRSHLAFSGFPIVSDRVYGFPEDRGELCLYAVEISFPSPNDGSREVVSLPPPDRTIP